MRRVEACLDNIRLPVVLNNSMPVQEGIGHSIATTADVGGASLVEGNFDYVSACTSDRRDVLLTDRGKSASSRQSVRALCTIGCLNCQLIITSSDDIEIIYQSAMTA
ncbi:MAG: hypothetical protein V3T06_03140 [Dehalococcoidia bacterium]